MRGRASSPSDGRGGENTSADAGRKASGWWPVSELVNRHEWYVALFSLAANRSNGIKRDVAESVRARDEALLVSLACVGRLRHPDGEDGRDWLGALDQLDKRLFDSSQALVPPTTRSLRRANRLRKHLTIRRGRPDAERGWAHPDQESFLEESLEPAALILLAGAEMRHLQITEKKIDVSRLNRAPEFDRGEILKRLMDCAEKATGPDPIWLGAQTLAHPHLDGRSHYNLACFFAQASESAREETATREKLIGRARDHLIVAVNATPGPARTTMADWAFKDPTLKPAISGWSDGAKLLGHVVPGVEATKPELPLAAIRAIGGYATKLKKLGTTSPGELAEELRPDNRRQALAKELGVGQDLLLHWRGLLDLLTIEGVGPAQVNLLEAAGISSPEELAHQEAAPLHVRLEETNTARQIVGRVPGVGTLEGWIEAAR